MNLKFWDQDQKGEVCLQLQIWKQNILRIHLFQIYFVFVLVILLPEDLYIIIRDYLQEYGVEEEGKYLITMDRSKGLLMIELIFEQNEKIRLERDAYSHKLVTFYISKINRIKLGLPFLTQLLITIDQNNQSLFITKYNCQDQFKQTQQNVLYFKHIVIPLILVLLQFYCILNQRAKSILKKRQLEQQELAQLKEEEEQI